MTIGKMIEVGFLKLDKNRIVLPTVGSSEGFLMLVVAIT
jgi:hypothetical protein